jgi:hypothetical protein
MATKLDICNGALVKLGAEPINSLGDGNKEANLCSLRIDVCTQTVLRSHVWKFMQKRVKLVPLESSPTFGFSNEFQLPADCLRVLQVNEMQYEYAVEDGKILSDVDVVQLLYISDDVDYTKIRPDVAEVISCYLAWDIAYALTQTSTDRQQMWAFYEETLRKARSIDAKEGNREQVTAELYVDSHYGLNSSNESRFYSFQPDA